MITIHHTNCITIELFEVGESELLFTRVLKLRDAKRVDSKVKLARVVGGI